MKRFLAVLLVITLLFMFFSVPAFARAGGGGGGGGGGGFGTSHYRNRTRSPLKLVIYVIGFLVSGISALILRARLSHSARNSRKLMKMLENKDSAWKYKDIQKRVRKAYFIIQNCWSEGDMHHARAYMSETLYEEFQGKLAVMKRDNERNVLEKIKLKDAMPVFVYDSQVDFQDMVWFRIKGSMVDYKINTEIQQELYGETYKGTFIEYWQFLRNEQGEWVLNRILQEDEVGNIPLS